MVDARCATTGADGPDSTEASGVAAGAAPAELWTSLCSCWHLVPQIMEEIVKVNSFYEVEQIVASRATDHGGNRESEQLLRGGADRGVPCHRSWKKSLKSVEVLQLQSLTEFVDEMKAVG